MQAYSQCPTPTVLDAETIRVYITSRGERSSDMQYISYPGYVDLARHDITRVVGIADKPVLPLGGPGSFDQFGITPSSFVQRGGQMYAYYTGWTRMRSVPYTLAIGMAVSHDGGGAFEKLGEGPIMAVSVTEPFFLSGPIVHLIEQRWHMWYLTGLGWLPDEKTYEPVYQIAHATSEDGITWVRNGKPVIPALTENECQASLALFLQGRTWHCLFAYRQPTGFRTGKARSYRLGYASSIDLETWVRDDSMCGIDVSQSGWDSQMICYPQVLQIDGRTLLFYCGNDFGREGFGIAEMLTNDGP